MASHLHPLFQRYGLRGFTILGVGSPSRDTAEKQKAFADEMGYTWTKVFDAERAAYGPYKVTGIPTLVLVGRDGRIVAASTGAGIIPQVRTYLEAHIGTADDGTAKGTEANEDE